MSVSRRATANRIALISNTLLSWSLLPPYSCSFPVETRRSVLRPWLPVDGGNDDDAIRRVEIGWAIEERDADTKAVERVTAGWNGEKDGNGAGVVEVKLPALANHDSLASTIWPSSVAMAVLCQSPSLQELFADRELLELGCGVGLMGLSVVESPAQLKGICLTDNDDDVIRALDELVDGRSSGDKIRLRHLEWRDEHEDAEKVDVIISADVAYYYFLLRPLMDTSRAFMKQQSVWISAGQANRECQWMLYHNLKEGCYDQLTDQHDPPWEGQTRVLLYNLDVCEWQKQEGEAVLDDVGGSVVEGTLGIAVMVHQKPGLSLSPLTDWDYVATESDEEALSMTF